MKYIDADKLKDQIERLRKNYVLSALDSLDDAEKIISAKYKSDLCKEILDLLNTLEVEQLSLPDGLYEAAEKYRRDSCNKAMLPNIDGPIPEHEGSVKDAFITGAKWMAGQWKTVEAVMQYDEFDDLVPTCQNMENYGFSVGDKVIVQIRKK